MRDKLVLLSGGLVAAALAYAPLAHADQQTFIQEVKSAGIIVPDEGAVKNAQLTCEWLRKGMSGKEVLLQMSTGSGLDIGHTAIFTAIAVKEYCPEFARTKAPQPSGPPQQGETLV